MAKKWYTKFRAFIINEVLGANDSPHRVALGVAVGMFVAFTPTIPFQTGLTFVLSIALRANKLVGLPVVWITNPATIIPIYLPMYLFGCWLLGESPEDVNWETLLNTSGGTMDYAGRAWEFMLQIFEPLWLGSMICAVILGVLSYVFTKIAILKYRDIKKITI